MGKKKKILLKLTGEIFISKDRTFTLDHAHAIIRQIKQLCHNYQIGIVIGGGNFFRGTKQSTEFGIQPTFGHYIGMLATAMNGLIIRDLCEQANLSATLFCALTCPEIGTPISQQSIANALKIHDCLIFSGGTGSPFVTTDTNAIIRSLQLGAHEIWKGTGVDGIYDDDPARNKQAHLIKRISFHDVLKKKLEIMDATAFTLAAQHNQTIRIFNIFTDNALIHAAHDTNFGSTIHG
jgi:uridylate kinase